MSDKEQQEKNDPDATEYAVCKDCARCGKQADVFVGLNDPDATEYAMCKDCARRWKAELIFSLGELDSEINKL